MAFDYLNESAFLDSKINPSVFGVYKNMSINAIKPNLLNRLDFFMSSNI